MNRRNNKKLTKNFKDYLVPLAGVLIVFVIILNFIFGGSDENTTEVKGNSPLEISLGDSDTEAYVVYANGDKKKVEGAGELYKGEKVQVSTNGEVTLNTTNSGNLVLNRLGELKYNEDGTYTLLSSDLWVNSNSNINVEMRYMKISGDGVFSLSQNEVASSIYVVYGNVEVKNLSGVKTNIQKGQKLSLMRTEANDENLDISLKKEEIDDYVKNDDWFIKNKGDYYLSQAEEVTTTGSGESNKSESGSISKTSGNDVSGFNYVSFNIPDESDVTKDTIDVEGSILDSIVYKVEINGQTAKINTEDRSFSLKGLKLTSKVNNIVYRIFDDSNKLIDKGVLTLYYSNGGSSTTSGVDNKNTSGYAGVENYSLSNSPSYKIISPAKNPYTTIENLVKIEGTVPSNTVKKIVVNDFQLQKFTPYSTYWSYFANSDFGNLKEGLNIYKIQYYSGEDKLINESTFSIVKEKSVDTTTQTNTQTGETTSTGEVTE